MYSIFMYMCVYTHTIGSVPLENSNTIVLESAMQVTRREKSPMDFHRGRPYMQ